MEGEMEQDSGSPRVVRAENDSDAESRERADTEDSRRRIEGLGGKSGKKEILRWIRKTSDEGDRAKRIWLAMEYFSQLRDFGMMRKLAQLQESPLERSTAFYVVALATRNEDDIDAARAYLHAVEDRTTDPAVLVKVALHYAALFSFTEHPDDLRGAGRISGLLIDAEEFEGATDVLLGILEEYPVTGFYLQALSASLLIDEPDRRAFRLQRYFEFLQARPPQEDLCFLITNIFPHPDPSAAQLLRPFITDRTVMSLYCHILLHRLPVGVA